MKLALLAGLVVAALGTAGLVRGAVAQTTDSGPSPAGTIAVTNAFIRPPVPPSRNAAAYFTVFNTTSRADRLLSVQTGAGERAVLHITEPDGSMSAKSSVVVPAHGRVVLAVGRGHVMIEHVIGTLKPGQHVDLVLNFADAGPIDVVAPVIAFGQPVPGGNK